MLIECFQHWEKLIIVPKQFGESLKSKCHQIIRLNLLEPMNMPKDSEIKQFQNLVDRYSSTSRSPSKPDKKPSPKKRNASPKRPIAKKPRKSSTRLDQSNSGFRLRLSTLNDLLKLFLGCISVGHPGEKTQRETQVMLGEIKLLFNELEKDPLTERLHGNELRDVQKCRKILKICNQSQGKFEKIKLKLTEENLFDEDVQVPIKSPEIKTKFRTNPNNNISIEKTSAKHGNPFENSSAEESDPGPMSRSRQHKSPQDSFDKPNWNSNKNSKFSKQEAEESEQTLQDLRQFILNEKTNLENEAQALRLRAEKAEEALAIETVKRVEAEKKLKSVRKENSRLMKSLKEYREEIYSRILNATMTSAKSVSATNKRNRSMNMRSDSRKNLISHSQNRKKKHSFLSKAEEKNGEKTGDWWQVHQGLNRPKPQSAVNKPVLPHNISQAREDTKNFLSDFNRGIESLLKNKPKRGTGGEYKKYQPKGHGHRVNSRWQNDLPLKGPKPSPQTLRGGNLNNGPPERYHKLDNYRNPLHAPSPELESGPRGSYHSPGLERSFNYPSRMAATLNLEDLSHKKSPLMDMGYETQFNKTPHYKGSMYLPPQQDPRRGLDPGFGMENQFKPAYRPSYENLLPDNGPGLGYDMGRRVESRTELGGNYGPPQSDMKSSRATNKFDAADKLMKFRM